MLHSLIGASIRFRFAVVAIVAGIVIVAGGQLRHMHADVLPEISAPVVRIQTEAQGLSVPEVEALVTVPLEKNLLEGVRGVTDVTSQSIPGLSAIDLHFAPGTSIYVARQLVQERLTGAFVLPNVSKPPVMLQMGTITLGALVGFFTVLGVAARNGILLVSHFRQLELDEGEPFGAGLVLRGAGERLSPILMTALATALALVPLVLYGNRPGRESEFPMAIVILGGLLTSTLLNLFVLPALYLRFGHRRERPAALRQ